MTQPDSSLKQAYHIRHFRRTDQPDLYAQARRIRQVVFIEEQQVPEAIEVDDQEVSAVHWLLSCPETNEPLGTARLVDYQEACQTRPVAKLGRIAVLASERGKGLGKLIVLDMLAYAKSTGYTHVILDSQTHALGFYQSLGFEPEGFEFIEADIPHMRMRALL